MNIRKAVSIFLLAILLSQPMFAQESNLSQYKPWFEKDLRAWTDSFKNFRLSEFRKLDPRPFGKAVLKNNGGLAKFLAVYKPLMVYSSDSGQFIDLYSGQLFITKVGNHYEGNADDGGEVFLCNTKTGYWVSIFYNSVGMWMEEAVWVSDSKFILAGISKNEDAENQPLIIVGDVSRGMLFQYGDTNKTCLQREHGYESPRLKRMNIKGI